MNVWMIILFALSCIIHRAKLIILVAVYFARVQWRLWVDWRNDTDVEYRCQENEQRIPVTEVTELNALLVGSVDLELFFSYYIRWCGSILSKN